MVISMGDVTGMKRLITLLMLVALPVLADPVMDMMALCQRPAAPSGGGFWPSGMIGLWRLEGDYVDSVTTTNTGVPNYHNPLNNGDFSTDCKVGTNSAFYALVNVSWVNTPNLMSYTAQFSVSMWVKLRSTSDDVANNFGLGLDTGEARIRVGGYLSYGTTNTYCIGLRDGGNYGADAQANSAYYAGGDTGWFHVVVTYDGTATPKTHMYKNAVELAVADYGMATTIGSSLNISLGGRHNEGGFRGNQDEVSVFSRVLTQSEVTALYNEGNGQTYP